MKKNRIKLLSFLLAVPLLLAACKLGVNNKLEEEQQNPETTVRMVKINPVVGLAARTVMPAEVNVGDLKYTLTYGYMDKETGAVTLISGRTYEELTSPSTPFMVPEGNMYFTLSAYNSNSTLKFTDTIENKSIVYGQEYDIEFTLRPAKYSSGYSVQTEVTFNFEDAINPSFVKGEIVSYNRDGSVNGTNTISNSSSYVTSGINDDSIPYIKLTKSVYMYKDYDYFITATFYDYVTDESGNKTISGIYKYNSAIMQSGTGKATETVNVPNFPKAYSITYHRHDDATPEVQYYAAMYGYDLWNATNYTWFTDESCTIKATSKLPGRSTGNIDLYSSAATNYHDLYVYDMEGKPVTIKTTAATPEDLPCLTITNGKTLYAYCGDDERLVVNNKSYNISKENCYIKGIYRDLEKTRTLCSETSSSGSFNLSDDETIYVEYAPIVTLKIVDRANPENIIKELRLYNNYYYLGDDYVSTKIGSEKKYSNDNSVLVWKYYSSATDEDSIIEKKNGQDVTETDTVIYAELDVPHILTVVDITAEDKTSESAILAKYKFCLRYVTVNTTSLSTSYYSNGSYADFIAGLYFDETGENEIPFGTTLTDLTEDKTIYASRGKKVTLTLNYNTAYKLVMNDENTKVVTKDGWYWDKNKKDLWNNRAYIEKDSRIGTYDTTVTYGPINPFQSCSGVSAEIVVSNNETLTPEVGHNNENNIVFDTSDARWIRYDYTLVAGTKYYLYFGDQGTDAYLCMINTTTGKYLFNVDYGSNNFVAPSTGNYEVYICPLSTTIESASLKGYLYIYEDPYIASAVTVKTEGDIEINKSEPDSETGIITLSTKYEYPSYQWKMGNRILGTDATFDFDPSDRDEYLAGETYEIVLTCGVLKSTITITIPEEEGSDE